MSDYPLPALLQQLSTQRPARHASGISGTDIKRIMAGDWPALYLEKTNQVEPEPLLELPPLIGKFLAPLHLAWFEWQTGRPVTDQEVQSIAEIPHPSGFTPYVTLDGRVVPPGGSGNPAPEIPWEAKITNGFMQQDKLIEREYPQLQWQMLCENSMQLELSVLYLNTRWESIIIDRDDDAIYALLDQAEQFWNHVKSATLPQQQVIEQVAPVREKVYMAGNADWTRFERVWLETRQPAKQFKEADAKLKKIIPEDAKSGFGESVTFTRNKAGAVTLLPMTQAQRDELAPYLEGPTNG